MSSSAQFNPLATTTALAMDFIVSHWALRAFKSVSRLSSWDSSSGSSSFSLHAESSFVSSNNWRTSSWFSRLICRFFTSRFESCLRTKSCADARFSCASARTSRRFTRLRRALWIPSLDLGLAQWVFVGTYLSAGVAAFRWTALRIGSVMRMVRMAFLLTV